MLRVPVPEGLSDRRIPVNLRVDPQRGPAQRWRQREPLCTCDAGEVAA